MHRLSLPATAGNCLSQPRRLRFQQDQPSSVALYFIISPPISFCWGEINTKARHSTYLVLSSVLLCLMKKQEFWLLTPKSNIKLQSLTTLLQYSLGFVVFCFVCFLLFGWLVLLLLLWSWVFLVFLEIQKKKLFPLQFTISLKQPGSTNV